MKGGYRIINFAKVPLTSGVASTIPGTYEATANAYGKATMISGLVIGGIDYPDFYAPFVEGNSSYTTTVTISGHDLTIAVAEGDSVTVTEA